MHTRPSLLRSFVRNVVLLAALLLPSVCLADPGTITLKTGEVLEVEVLDLELGRLVNVKFEDGTVKSIMWDEIEDLKMSKAQAPVHLDEVPPPAPAPPPPAPTPAPVQPPEPPALTLEQRTQKIRAENYQQLQMVDQEIDDIDEEMPSIGGGVALTLIGFGGGLTVLGHAAAVSSSCGDLCDLSANYVVGVGGLILGVVGVVVMANQSKKRAPYQTRLKELKVERTRLRFQLHGPQTSTGATLTYSF